MLELTMTPDLDLGIYKDYIIYDSKYKLEPTWGTGEKGLSFKRSILVKWSRARVVGTVYLKRHWIPKQD